MSRLVCKFLLSGTILLLQTLCTSGATLQVAVGGTDTGDCTSSACASLVYAISQASSNDTIEIAKGIYRGEKNRNLLLGTENSSAQHLTIRGTGSPQDTVLDLERSGRGFRIGQYAGKAVVETLTLINGSCAALPDGEDRNGAGFHLLMTQAIVQKVRLLHMDCTLDSVEYTQYSGAAIYLRDSAATLIGVEVEDAIANHGGGVAAWGNDRSHIQDSYFLRGAGTFWAGCMLMEDNVSTEFNNVRFSYSSCGYGGALDDGGTAHPYYKNCTFEFGESIYGGAAYHYGDSYTRFEQVIFQHNIQTAATVYINAGTYPSFVDCIFYNNTATGEAGALRSYYAGAYGPMVLNRVHFVRNSAAMHAGAVMTLGNLEFKDCVFDSNSAEAQGAAVSIGPSTGSILFRNVQFMNNKAEQGGAVYFLPSTVPESRQVTAFDSCAFQGNSARRNGGAMSVEWGLDLNIVNSTFMGNSAGISGGAVHLRNLMPLGLLVAFNDTIFEHNSATGTGGTLGCEEPVPETRVAMLRVNIADSTTYGNGGALHYHCSGLHLKDSNVRRSRALEGSGGAMAISAKLDCEAGKGKFHNVHFDDNAAGEGGGVLYFDHLRPRCRIPLTGSSWNTSANEVWSWSNRSNFTAALQNNMARYGNLQATSPARVSARCDSSRCSNSAAGNQIEVDGFPGVELRATISMIDDFGSLIIAPGLQVEVALQNEQSGVYLKGVTRRALQDGLLELSQLHVIGGYDNGSTVPVFVQLPRSMATLQDVKPASVLVRFDVCPAGYQNSIDLDTNAKQCTMCSSGRFSLQDSESCTVCPTGRYANSSGSSKCSICPRGHGCPRGTTEPAACIPGFFQPAEEAADCLRCAQGSYQELPGASACVSCPQDLWTQFPGTESADHCACAEGSYRDETNRLKCLPCPNGLICPFGSDQLQSSTNITAARFPQVPEGLMALFLNNKLETFDCRDGRALCRGARTVFESGGDTDFHSMCAHNATGVACARCIDDGYRTKTTCISCPGVTPGSRTAVYCLWVALQSFFVSMLIFQLSLSGPSSPLPGAGATLLSFAQSILLVTGYSVAFPTQVDETQESAGFLHLDTNYDLSFAYCFLVNDFLAEVVFKMTLPFWIWLWFACLLMHSRLLRAMNLARCLFQTKLPCLPALFRNKAYDWLHRKLSPWYPMCIPDIVNAVLKAQSSFFIGITAQAAAIFRFKTHPSGRYTVQDYPEVLDQSPEWWSAVPVSLCGIAIFSFGFLAVYIYLVVVAPQRIGRDPFFQRAYRGIWEKFHPAGWWFGVVQLLYGLGLNIMPVISRSGRVQLLTAILLSFWYVFMLVQCQPWIFSLGYYTDLTSKLGIALFILVAFTVTPTDSFQTETIQALMIFASVLPVAVICCSIAYSVYHSHVNSLAGFGKRVKFVQYLTDMAKLVGSTPRNELRSYAFNLLDRDVEALRTALDTIQFTMLGLQAESFYKRRCAPIPFQVAIAGRLEGELLARGLEDKDDARMQLRTLQTLLNSKENDDPASSSHDEAKRRLPNRPRWVRDLLRSCDDDENGTISQEEFVTALQECLGEKSAQLSSEELANVFSHIDVDQSGHISPTELFHAMQDLPTPVYPPGAQEVPRAGPNVAEDSDSIEPEAFSGTSTAAVETQTDCKELFDISDVCEGATRNMPEAQFVLGATSSATVMADEVVALRQHPSHWDQNQASQPFVGDRSEEKLASLAIANDFALLSARAPKPAIRNVSEAPLVPAEPSIEQDAVHTSAPARFMSHAAPFSDDIEFALLASEHVPAENTQLSGNESEALPAPQALQDEAKKKQNPPVPADLKPASGNESEALLAQAALQAKRKQNPPVPADLKPANGSESEALPAQAALQDEVQKNKNQPVPAALRPANRNESEALPAKAALQDEVKKQKNQQPTQTATSNAKDVSSSQTAPAPRQTSGNRSIAQHATSTVATPAPAAPTAVPASGPYWSAQLRT